MSTDIVEKLGQFTDEQQTVLQRVLERHIVDSEHPEFKNRGFRDWILGDVHKAIADDCVMVKIPDMWLGIEPDGYTHS